MGASTVSICFNSFLLRNPTHTVRACTIDLLLDACSIFMALAEVDIILSFMTGVYVDGRLHMDLRTIANEYAKTWLPGWWTCQTRDDGTQGAQGTEDSTDLTPRANVLWTPDSEQIVNRCRTTEYRSSFSSLGWCNPTVTEPGVAFCLPQAVLFKPHAVSNFT